MAELPLVASRGGRLSLVLAAQAELLSAPTREVAARRLADLLVARVGFDRVAIAFREGSRLGLPVLSGGQSADAGSPLVRRLMAAMHESMDQRLTLQTPPARDEAIAPIRAAQQQLLADLPGQVLCVPLIAPPESFAGGSAGAVPGTAEGPVVAVLCAQRCRAPQGHVAGDEAAALDHVAAFAAPILGLHAVRDRSGRQRLSRWWQGGPSPASARVRRAGVAVALVVLGWLSLWPMAWQVGAQAQVEGAVQRVITAPAAGFLQQVHVRPGDTVTEGQLLVEMADRELLVERERWASQLAQAEGAVSEANARADRAQLMIQWSKVSEAQAQLELVESQLERTRLVAPFNAVVARGDLSQSLGAPVQAGAELMTLVPQGQYRVMVQVDEADMPRLAVGQGGLLALSALPWDSLRLQVSRITPMAQPRDGHNVFEVEAELLDVPADLRPGLVGHARIDVGQRPWLVGVLGRWADQARLLWWRWWG